MAEKIMGVYVIKCLPTGVCYVGSSTNITKRWAEHKNTIAKHKHRNKPLREASKLFAPNDFAYILVEQIFDEKELAEREKYYINLLGAQCGVFNVSTNTKHMSEGTRKALSKNVSGGKNHGAKKVICLETKEIFDSASEAAQKYKTDRSHIAKCCNGKHHTSGGHTWKYLPVGAIPTQASLF